MEPFFPPPPPPQFSAHPPLPTAAPPPLEPPLIPTVVQLQPQLQPQVVLQQAPLAFMPSQTNLQELQHQHMTQVVATTPATTATPPRQSPNHPPYAEMIITAIKALNEKTGSSKQAIAKFIDSTYSNLPQTHSALLTHHLKRLKDNGLLVTIKNSYTLPPININNNLSSSPSVAAAAAGGGSSSLPKRGRGRPPKTTNTATNPGPSPNLNLNSSSNTPTPITTTNTPAHITSTTPAPAHIITTPALANITTIPAPMVVLPITTTNTPAPMVVVPDRSDEVSLPAKRGRGRPPRSIAKPKASPKPKPKPISGGGSRPRGRPRKLVTDDGSGSGPAAGSDLVPGKAGMVILPPNEIHEKTINGLTITSTTTSGRPVGRPRKLDDESSPVAAAVVNGAVVKPVSSSGRSVGRPRKTGAVGRPRKVGAVGRPRRAGTVGRPAKAGGGVVKKTAASSTGRPVGRPRKEGNNIKDRVVALLEESLGLGMNQSVPDMYIRFTQLYTIITGRDYNLPGTGATTQGDNQ